MNMSLGTSHPRTNTDQLKRAVGLFQVTCAFIHIFSPCCVSNKLSSILDFFFPFRYLPCCQQAAGCFCLLKDDIVPTIELPPGSPKPPSPDLSDSCLSALEHLSLSQAQELVWQQAVKGTFVPSSKLISSFFFFVVF
jgi:hypothetical protein